MKVSTILAVALSLIGVACGSSPANTPSTFHCATQGGQGHTACIEFVGLSGSDLTAAHDGCGAGTWGSGACARSGILGGCQLLPNQIDWYYAGGNVATQADVMNLCMAAGATFVAPPV
jgi:hypothetical protein